MKQGDLRVWWIPQVPMRAFHVPVKTIAEAKLILNTLADYDLFQWKNKVKPDYANAGGLEVYSDDIDGNGMTGWEEWYNKDADDIDNVDENGKTIDEET
jgi:hypothetical protein